MNTRSKGIVGIKRVAAVIIGIVMMSVVFSMTDNTYASGNKAISVSLGCYHGGMLLDDGTLWAWGSNGRGQIGDGTRSDQHSPVKVMDNVKFADFGVSLTSAAIKVDGSLWLWGQNDGMIGNGNTEDQHEPCCIMTNVSKLCHGIYTNGAITNDGSLWMWGDEKYGNRFGQIGNGTTDAQITPVKVLSNVKSVSIATDHCAAIKNDGSLWVWGSNVEGQIGDGTNISRYSPVKVMENVSNVYLKSGVSAAIKDDGTLWTWGKNTEGVIGDGTEIDRNKPVKIMNSVKSVALGRINGAAIKNDGSLWTWGNNGFGNLGDGSREKELNPVKVLDNVRSVNMEEGNDRCYMAAVKEDRTLWMWGARTRDDLLGDGEMPIDSSVPIKILDNVSTISLSYVNASALRADGSVWSWGSNFTGRLGDGTIEHRSNPVKIFPFTDENGQSGSSNNPGITTIKKMITSSAVKLSPTRKVYTGKALKPTERITISGKVLNRNRDYTVTYKNNKKVGIAKIIVKGKGNYVGTVTKTFKIVPDRIKIKKATTKKYGAITLMNIRVSKSKAKPAKIQLQLAYDKAFKKKIKTSTKSYKKVKKTGKLPTLGKKLKKKKHYLRVRVMKKVGGKWYYGPWSNTVVIKGR